MREKVPERMKSFYDFMFVHVLLVWRENCMLNILSITFYGDSFEQFLLSSWLCSLTHNHLISQ